MYCGCALCVVKLSLRRKHIFVMLVRFDALDAWGVRVIVACMAGYLRSRK